MKTLSIKTLFISVLVLLSFNACSSDDGDTTKPVINLISPAEGADLRVGNQDGIHLEMDLEDNENLASYKIDIHSNFDGHTHKAEGETTAFSFSKSWNVTGKNAHIHHHEIIIPENATHGKYHLMVYCVDAAGNESYVARNITLSEEGEDDHNDE